MTATGSKEKEDGYSFILLSDICAKESSCSCDTTGSDPQATERSYIFFEFFAANSSRIHHRYHVPPAIVSLFDLLDGSDYCSMICLQCASRISCVLLSIIQASRLKKLSSFLSFFKYDKGL